MKGSWTDVFLAMAYIARARSHDNQTQHGCVIATKDNRIVSVGFNGLPANFDDEMADRLGMCDRPDKYPYMIHAEFNAVANAHVDLHGCVAYLTGEPCDNCIMWLYHNGITEIIYDDRYSSKTVSRAFYDKTVRNNILKCAKKQIKLIAHTPDFSWMTLNHVITTGVVSGYFSILHPGHIDYITKAAELCDKLIVVVNNDKQATLKGCPALFDECERMKLVKNIRGVSEVFLSIDTDRTINKTLETIKPTFFFNSGDVTREQEVREAQVCKDNHIKMVFLHQLKTHSSSKLGNKHDKI